jgi:L-rhamnose-H+ transport protein
MEPNTAVGLGLSVLSGTLDGSMAVPMQFATRWRWENIWLVYSIFGMVLVPWGVSSITLSNTLRVYQQAPTQALWAAFGFGAGFGIGSLLFGTGIALVGMSLGYALVVSLTAVNGALIPLIVLNPEKLGTFQGKMIFVALGVLLVGISLCSLAARRRKSEKPLLVRERTHFAFGLLACVCAGFFSPMLNLAFAFGAPISHTALSLGASEMGASIALLNLTLFAGFLPTAGYCIYLLNKNRTWNEFFLANTASHWFYGFMMGLPSLGAFLVYGIATIYLGAIGPVLGWPVYMGMVIVTANTWGFARGEWRGSDLKTYIYLCSGIFTILVAIYIVSLGP